MIQERIVANPNRRRIIKQTPLAGQANTDGNFVADVTVADEGNIEQAGTLVTAALLNSFVRFDVAQSKSSLEKQQARANMGAVSNAELGSAFEGVLRTGMFNTDWDSNVASLRMYSGYFKVAPAEGSGSIRVTLENGANTGINVVHYDVGPSEVLEVIGAGRRAIVTRINASGAITKYNNYFGDNIYLRAYKNGAAGYLYGGYVVSR